MNIRGLVRTSKNSKILILYILPFIFDNGSYMNLIANVNDPEVRTQINNGTLNYDDLIFLPISVTIN